MPDACSEPIPGVYARHPVGPSRNRGAPAQHRHHHPLIHAVPAGPKAFQSVDRRQVALRVGEGHQFTMDQIPVAGRSAEAWCADLLLPVGVGQWIGGAPGQDQPFRHFQGREPGVEMIEPAPDHGRFGVAGLGAEALMVPVAPFQGAVDEESLGVRDFSESGDKQLDRLRGRGGRFRKKRPVAASNDDIRQPDFVRRKQRIRGQTEKERLEDGENRWCKEVLWKDVKRAQTL